jgi:hypothetical protein
VPKRRCSRRVRTDVYEFIAAQLNPAPSSERSPTRCGLAGQSTGWGFSQTSVLKDVADGSGAAPALGATAKAPIERAGRFWRAAGLRCRAHVAVGQHIARADDHVASPRQIPLGFVTFPHSEAGLQYAQRYNSRHVSDAPSNTGNRILNCAEMEVGR